MFGLCTRFDLRPGAGEAFDRLAAEAAARIAVEANGPLAYATHTVEGEPDVRVAYELYRDRQAFDESQRTAQAGLFRTEREQYLAVAPRVELLDLTSAKGIPTTVPPEWRTSLTGIRASLITVRRRRDRLSREQVDDMLDFAVSYCDRLSRDLENTLAGGDDPSDR